MGGQQISTSQNERRPHAAIGILNGKWVIPVVRTLHQGTMRYSNIEKAVPATQRALTLTLKQLERNGMVSRTVYPTVPLQVEYKLTPLGIKLLELTEIVITWSEKHDVEIRRAQKAYDKLTNP